MPEARRRRSVRRVLILALLSVVSTSWVIAAVVSYLDARHEISEVLDAHLTQTASLISVQWDGQDTAVDTEHVPVVHPYGRQVMFQIWRNGTSLGLHSLNAPNTPISPVTHGFSDVSMNGESWRVFGAWNPDRRILVQVAEKYEERDELTAAVARNVIVPLAIALPLIATAIWITVGRAVRSLTRISEDVMTRAPDSLAPIDAADAPAEIEGLVANLNQLFARVRGSIERERQFTADAAHELRTPIAAVRAQAQVARSATSDGERTHALDGVIAGCDRASHAVAQMLTLARLSSEAVSFEARPCGITAVLKSVMLDLAPTALDRRIDLELKEGGDAVVSGDPGFLAILFRNLIDNALRYSPAQSRVVVDVGVSGSEAFVTVTDEGPGIAAGDRARVGRRFYRVPGNQASGSGLGLSIANRIVELHGAVMSLETPASGVGLRVRVSFPA